ncbi:MAG: hypothetical protein ACPGWR_05365 [Ardenticatenaceae bacterium]
MSIKKISQSTYKISKDKSPQTNRQGLFHAALAGSQQVNTKWPVNTFAKPSKWMLFHAAQAGLEQGKNTLD